ncbi:GGDEF domain-containing protein [Vibrio mediterranei]|uniref:sensor domain-containing diguanylate cyclase n=1 Tax=Vibrio mediterranei TaxID=689 RepID=UPI00183CAE01|nr:GGDEF domain-containing protein [Vibrio mediterranei]NUW71736.1 GGDEF domain-containing protein [Vibrio mediterranei]
MVNATNKLSASDVSHQLFLSAFNSLDKQIAIIDETGLIIFANTSWNNFDTELDNAFNWFGLNYIEYCEEAALDYGDDALKVLDGLKQVITSQIKVFSYEYRRYYSHNMGWYLIRAAHFAVNDNVFAVISHCDITSRKLAEEELLRLAHKDELTQIANRRHYDLRIKQLWDSAIKQRRVLGMLLIDIDDFKVINDKFGHQVGDEVLVKLAEELKRVTREEDICARIGGDEFVVVIDGANLDIATNIGKALISNIELLCNSTDSVNSAHCFSVSIGVSSIQPNESNSYRDFLRDCDLTLYTAKKRGKNMIVS